MGRTFFRFFLTLMTLAAALAAAEPYDWKQAETLYPGLLHASFRPTEPRPMRIQAVRLDLRVPGYRFQVTAPDPDFGKPMPDYPARPIRTRRQTSRNYLLQARKPIADGGEGLDMIFAVNSAPWRPWERPFTHRYADGLGLFVRDGKLLDRPNGNPAFVIFKDGKIDLVETSPTMNTDEIQLATAGISPFFVLRRGAVTEQGGTRTDPRTAFGLSADRRYLFFLTVDGRQKGESEGMTQREVGEWLRFLGAGDGINMDGGGSVTMLYWDRSAGAGADPVRVLSRQRGGAERPVGCTLGLYRLPSAAR